MVFPLALHLPEALSQSQISKVEINRVLTIYLTSVPISVAVLTGVLTIFLVIVQKYPYKSSAKGRRTYFGLQFQVTVYPGRRVMEAGAWSGWSYGTHNQDAERGECC